MATKQIEQYTPLSRSSIETNEENQQLAIINDDEEEEEGDDEEDEDENHIQKCPSQNVKVGRVNLMKCKGSHLGNKSIYHGAVKVHNFLKISMPTNTSDVQQQPSSILSTPSPGIPTGPFSPIGLAKPFEYIPGSELAFQDMFSVPSGLTRSSTSESSNRPSDVSAELLDSSENNDTRDSLTNYPPSGCGSDQEALIIPDSNKVKRRNLILLIAGIALLSISLITIIVLLVLYYGINTADIDNLPMDFNARLTTRGVWFAFPPKKQMPPFKYNPVPFAIACHTATVPCYTQHTCRTAVRNIQSGQMETIFDDISYNFLVGGDGYIYEGRGWTEASAGTPLVDCSGLSIGFIGNFIVDKPPLKQINAFKLILIQGLKLGKLGKHYNMFMQKQIKRTESPGEALIEILEVWPHWAPFGSEHLLCNKTIT